ncbi:hypothetical protein M8J77_002470 [Diaphorina citri]|nr:hypothetical protein M8J77_002470 [Diaphorina citri]
MPPRKAERRPSPDASGGVRYRNHNLTPPNTQGAARKVRRLQAPRLPTQNNRMTQKYIGCMIVKIGGSHEIVPVWNVVSS